MQAVIYARISRDDAGLGLGVERQLQDCHQLADQRGWNVTTEYVDNNVSAYVEKKRPAYQRMLAAIRAGQVQAVIVWDLDRLTRRPIEIEEVISLADEHHVALASIGGDVDLSTDNGRMYARIKGAVARAESERKSSRHKRANLQAVEAGLPPSRRAFGYPGTDQRPEAVGKGLPVSAELVAAEAEAVRALFASALAGDSIRTLVVQMNETGLKTTRGTDWERNGVRWLLVNPRYAGLREHNKKITGKGNWKPLVPEDEWRAVQDILAKPDRRTNHRGTTARIHLLGGLALCGVCGDGTTVVTSYASNLSKESRYRQYKCRKKAHLGRRADYIDEYVEAVMIAWASSPEAQKYLVQKSGPDLAALRQDEATLTIRLDQLAEQFADGTLSDSQLRAGTTRLRARLAEVQQALKSSTSAATLGDLIGVDARAVWQGMNLDRRRKAISLVFTVTLAAPPTDRPMSSRFDPAMVQVERR